MGCKAERGVTLIEMLVTMFIIALLSSFVILSINIEDPNDVKSQLEKQREQLLTFATLATDRAVLTGEPIGLLIMPPNEELSWRYVWMRYRGGIWVDAEEPLVGDSFPDNIELTLEVDGELVDFYKLAELIKEGQGNQFDSIDDELQTQLPPPSIVFYPGGEVTNFLLTLFDASIIDQQLVLTSERTGNVEWLSPEQALEYL
ncbi:pilus assembly FimT family protein [Aurantivibrio plasticivorans]